MTSSLKSSADEFARRLFFFVSRPFRIRILIVTADSVPIRPSGGPLLAVRRISDRNGNSLCDGT